MLRAAERWLCWELLHQASKGMEQATALLKSEYALWVRFDKPVGWKWPTARFCPHLSN